MHTTRFGLIAALIAATVGACQCAEPLQVLAPKIQIGDPYDPTFSVCQTNFVKDCAYDYGEVGIGRPKLFSFVIKDPTNVDLNITSITIEGSPNFTLDGPVPETVDAATGGIGQVVTVKYDPHTETSEEATIVIASDAQNIPQGENVEIKLTAVGKDLGCPAILVDPGQCNFGAVGVGAEGTCQLSLRNNGSQELQISGVRLSDDTPANVFHPGLFIVPAFVQPGTATTVSFSATPDQASQISGTLIVTSDDCASPETDVPLVVVGANTPTAVARVKSINGTANSSATPAVEPLDDVVLSGDQSVPGTSGATITAYSWNIVEKPPESSVQLSRPTSVDTGFEFDSANGTVSGLDVAGTFRIRLTVTDSNGAISQNDATVTLNAVPTEGLHVQLSWSASADDIDLHLFKGNTPNWCTQPNDCYYLDCKQSGFSSPPNWDGQSGFTSGDPSLDIDDLDGFGPENINIDTPVNGTYVIGVHAYGGGSSGFGSFTPTDVEVKVFVGGALVQSLSGHLNATDDFWTVAKVQVNGTTTVTPVDTMSHQNGC